MVLRSFFASVDADADADPELNVEENDESRSKDPSKDATDPEPVPPKETRRLGLLGLEAGLLPRRLLSRRTFPPRDFLPLLMID